MSSFISMLALLAVVSAAPAELRARLTTPISTISPVITLCTGLPVPAQGCANLAIISDACVNFTGGKSVLNHNLTGLKSHLDLSSPCSGTACSVNLLEACSLIYKVIYGPTGKHQTRQACRVSQVSCHFAKYKSFTLLGTNNKTVASFVSLAIKYIVTD
ncbi:hypothetical protein B0H34DRAFT_808529 [Crassisporium funariophilum]|nr:hypothetical protein B0H34DRAFT_808529 [Crassisporium funariophilum]